MTQKELAAKAGTSQPAIARLESGRYRNVSLAFLRKVGKALGAQPEVHLRVEGLSYSVGIPDAVESGQGRRARCRPPGHRKKTLNQFNRLDLLRPGPEDC